MKKITVQPVHEEAQFFCDKHPERECYSELKTMSWYGSEFDNMGIKIHLCDVCLFDMFKYLQKEFGVTPKDLY